MRPIMSRRMAMAARSQTLMLVLIALMPAFISGCCCLGGGFNSFQSPGAAPARGALEGEPRLQAASAGTNSTKPLNRVPAHRL